METSEWPGPAIAAEKHVFEGDLAARSGAQLVFCFIFGSFALSWRLGGGFWAIRTKDESR